MLLHLEALGLAVLTIALAGPVSVWLARAQWPARAPRAALMLWQAVGLGGGLGVLTAGLTLAAADLDTHWRTGLLDAVRDPAALRVWGWFGVALTGCVGLYLVSATIGSTARILAVRRAHRHRLDLVSTGARIGVVQGDSGGTEVRLVDHPHAMAYCLPGFRPRVVLTQGARNVLSDGELDAVLTHEQAHARGHHDLVIQPFIAWAQTFPFLRPARDAVGAVSLLVEMLADDAAFARCGRVELQGALGRLTDQHLAVGGGNSAGWRDGLDARVARINDGAPARLGAVTVSAVYALAVAIVALPPVVLLLS